VNPAGQKGPAVIPSERRPERLRRHKSPARGAGRQAPEARKMDSLGREPQVVGRTKRYPAAERRQMPLGPNLSVAPLWGSPYICRPDSRGSRPRLIIYRPYGACTVILRGVSPEHVEVEFFRRPFRLHLRLRRAKQARAGINPAPTRPVNDNPVGAAYRRPSGSAAPRKCIRHPSNENI